MIVSVGVDAVDHCLSSLTVGGASSRGWVSLCSRIPGPVQVTWQYLAHWLARLRTWQFPQRSAIFSMISARSIYRAIWSIRSVLRFRASSIRVS